MCIVHVWLQLVGALASSFHYSAAAERWGKRVRDTNTNTK